MYANLEKQTKYNFFRWIYLAKKLYKIFYAAPVIQKNYEYIDKYILVSHTAHKN